MKQSSKINLKMFTNKIEYILIHLNTNYALAAIHYVSTYT